MLKNKTILITGASKGLGKAMALEYAKNNATVIFTYSKDLRSANETLAELKTISNCNHKCYQVDATSLKDNLNLSTIIKTEFETIDALVNNAGISEFLPLALMDKNDWKKIVDTNLDSLYATTKAFLPFFIRKKSGHILNISSLAGVRILAAPISYCTSKAGVKGFTESLSKEIGRYNIKVNCLAPGILDGGVANGIPENKLNSFIQQVSLKRIGTFEEVAKFSTFLISDKNSYMNGNTIIMDGGL